MFQIRKIKKIKKFFKKLPLIIAEHAFLTCLILFLLALILGALLFYKYCFLAQKSEPKALEQPLVLNKGLRQKVLNIWQENEIIFQEVDSKQYSNPFIQSISSPE